MTAVDRVAARALTLRPLRLVLSVLAAPFYVVGLVAALVVVGFLWCWAAVGVGFADARERIGPKVDGR